MKTKTPQIADQFICLKTTTLTLANESPINHHIVVTVHGLDIFDQMKYIGIDFDLDSAEIFCKELIGSIKRARALKQSKIIMNQM